LTKEAITTDFVIGKKTKALRDEVAKEASPPREIP